MELPTTSLTAEDVVMVLCWMTCCWEQAGAGLAGGLLSGPREKTHTHTHTNIALPWVEVRTAQKNTIRHLLETEEFSHIFSWGLVLKLDTVVTKLCLPTLQLQAKPCFLRPPNDWMCWGLGMSISPSCIFK